MKIFYLEKIMFVCLFYTGEFDYSQEIIITMAVEQKLVPSGGSFFVCLFFHIELSFTFQIVFFVCV